MLLNNFHNLSLKTGMAKRIHLFTSDRDFGEEKKLSGCVSYLAGEGGRMWGGNVAMCV
jgi:hypothetical protein